MPKKKKKTKEQLEAERQAREEEERRLKEEEDRLKEKERLIEEEKARLALNEHIQRRNDEIQKFEKEEKEISEITSTIASVFSQKHFESCRDTEWKSYISCSETIYLDCDLPRYLNTFYSQESEHEYSSMEEVVSFADDCCRYFNYLTAKLLNGVYECKYLKQFQSQFQSLLMEKTTHVTNKILCDYSLHSREDQADEKDNIFLLTKSPCSGMTIFEHQEKKHNKTRKEELSKDLGLSLEFPKSISSRNNIIARICQISFDILPYQRFCSDGELMSIGRKYYINILERDIMAKKWNGMVICQTPDNIVSPVTDIVGNIKCQISIPNNIVLSENTTVGTWEEEKAEWSELNVKDTKFDKRKNIFSFHLISPSAIIGLVQNKLLDFPYKGWKICPILDKNSNYQNLSHESNCTIEYTLKTSRLELKFQLKDTKCKLLLPQLPQLNHILGKELSPGELLNMMSESGIHLLPQDNQISLSSQTKSKSKIIEEQFVKDCSFLCPAFKMEGSKYNVALNEHCACFHINESDAFTGNFDGTDNPATKNLFYMETDRESSSFLDAPGANQLPESCGKIRCSVYKNDDCAFVQDEEVNKISEEMRITEVSLHGFLCVKQISSPEAIERTKLSNPLVTSTLETMLRLTRPLIFTDV